MTDTTPRHRLPGDPNREDFLEQAIRVNQAGEYGAKRIYEGQLAVLGKGPNGDTLRHMAEQEQEHLDAFNHLMTERRVRPTLLQPLWHVAGFALGAGTALMGEKAAMACTVAVESVISDHYQEQIDALGDDEAQLRETITRFREEEIEHHDIGLENGAEDAPAYPVLCEAIKAGCRAAIWLAKRI